MNISYLYAITYFSLMSLLLIISGIWIFIEKIGFNLASIIAYYAGDQLHGIPAKSLYGQLEVLVPHLGAMGLFIMVVMHFLVFTPVREKKYFIPLSLLLFFSAFTSITSGVIISFGVHQFAIVKLVSFCMFCTLSFIALVMLLSDVLKSLKTDTDLIKIQTQTQKQALLNHH